VSEASETRSGVYKFEKLYMRYIWTCVKHNSSVGTHIEILELLTTLILFRASSLGVDVKYMLYFLKSCRDMQVIHCQKYVEFITFATYV